MRSGGHSWAVWSLRGDALLIDLGELRGLAVRASDVASIVRRSVGFPRAVTPGGAGR